MGFNWKNLKLKWKKILKSDYKSFRVKDCKVMVIVNLDR